MARTQGHAAHCICVMCNPQETTPLRVRDLMPMATWRTLTPARRNRVRTLLRKYNRITTTLDALDETYGELHKIAEEAINA